MEKIDYTDLILQTGNISDALNGLKILLFQLPTPNEIEASDLDKINGIVAAITVLAEKNEKDVSDYFE